MSRVTPPLSNFQLLLYDEALRLLRRVLSRLHDAVVIIPPAVQSYFSVSSNRSWRIPDVTADSRLSNICLTLKINLTCVISPSSDVVHTLAYTSTKPLQITQTRRPHVVECRIRNQCNHLWTTVLGSPHPSGTALGSSVDIVLYWTRHDRSPTLTTTDRLPD